MLNNSPDQPLINRALHGTYPPGSTFKPFMALAALETGQAHAAAGDPRSAATSCSAATRFRDDKKGGHGTVDMHKSIVDVLRHLLLHARPTTWASTTSHDFMRPVRLRPAHRHRHRRRVGRACCPRRNGSASASSSPSSRSGTPARRSAIGIGQGYNAYTPLQLAQAMADARQRRRDVSGRTS
ncbi:MAG: penicillin-binding transpeptidase domain-containing protein [Comamonadaceae bacterium]|nr:penicillin-binding transpeptidase domain-containing protein [Comamonadaceae bacterium]